MIKTRPILLFPCNGNALEALDCLDESWRCVGLVDDSPEKLGHRLQGIEIFDRAAFARWPDARVLAVPGGPDTYAARKTVIEGLGIAQERFAQVVHPKALVSKYSCIGHNTLIMAGVVLTSNAVVGDHCCLLPNTVVHHDSSIGHWSLVGANVTIAGGTRIGSNCYIGAASSIMHGLTVGDGALVGFGSNVIRDVAAGARVAGNPARALHRQTIF